MTERISHGRRGGDDAAPSLNAARRVGHERELIPCVERRVGKVDDGGVTGIVHQTSPGKSVQEQATRAVAMLPEALRAASY